MERNSTLRLIFLLVLALPAFAKAQVLFEGYSKVTHLNKHIGFVVYRFGFDAKKKEFNGTYFLRTQIADTLHSESLITRSNNKLQPISFVYNELDEPSNNAKTVEGEFKNGVYHQTIRQGGKAEKKKLQAPPDGFFSFMLLYKILNSPKGMRVGEKYTYKAFAEEDGGLYEGTAYVQKQEKMLGVDCFKVLIRFKGREYVNFVTEKGEIIKYIAPNDGVESQLVAQPAEAIGAIKYSANAVSIVFGGVPKGNVHPLNAAKSDGEAKMEVLKNTPPPSADVDTPKKEGVAPGQGITIKGQKKSDE